MLRRAAIAAFTIGAGAVLYVDNDPMLNALAPHAAELGRRFTLADPPGDALRDPAEWALFALDDLAPWRKSLRRLATSVFTRKFFSRALGRPITRRA